MAKRRKSLSLQGLKQSSPRKTAKRLAIKAEMLAEKMAKREKNGSKTASRNGRKS